jgi:preprotein translocase subunit SecD
VVGLFMMLYYRLPGVVAAVALIIYTVIVLAIYKAIPVTLTLAGIAGFIVSLGMAVDANVLIFERMKEELSAGRTMKAAIDVGFSRAWPAIRDSNITTFIACGILYWFGSSIPTATVVMGFSVTLFIGVAVSMFSAIVVSKTLLLLLAGRGFAKRLALFGVEAKAEAKDA